MNLNSASSNGSWPAGGAVPFCCPFSLSVFFPAFNDAPALPDLLERTFTTLRDCVLDFEVIVVDDGSSDETGEVLEQLRKKYPELRVVTHPKNRGYGAALRTGFTQAQKDFIFYTDGDGQYDPAELKLLLRALTEKAALVNGYKLERQDPWHRVAIGWLYNQFARRLFRIQVRDIDCDFRLIRKSVLDSFELISTSGTICVELVRRLEMTGAELIEVPVHHYPRLHGRSQFFRVRSLAATFLQLCMLFFRLVVARVLLSPLPCTHRALAQPDGRPSLKAVGLIGLFIVLLSFLAYGRALQLPFIADDYLQIELGRRYGAISGWFGLSQDPLYRCRATSLILTYWTDRWFGPDPFIFNLCSLAIHILNSLLVFALGIWRSVGWRVSAVAACFFAVSERHHEAVIWYASVPELLVFFFSLLSFLFWTHWVQAERPSRIAYWSAFVCFVAALLSKESAVAVVPLLLFAGNLQRRRLRLLLAWVLPFGLCAMLYFGLIFLSRQTHLHFHDGTFSVNAPFIKVMFRSSLRLVWIWGTMAVIALVAWRAWWWRKLLATAAIWWVITLLPYCFLTYMPYVPSRHTYFASVGLALLIAAALIEFHIRNMCQRRRVVTAIISVLIIAHQCIYLWTKKQRQFEARARPTEQLLDLASRKTPVVVKCFPYAHSLAEIALRVRDPDAARSKVVFANVSTDSTEAVDLCAGLR